MLNRLVAEDLHTLEVAAGTPRAFGGVVCGFN
jgi:hypothetical protein